MGAAGGNWPARWLWPLQPWVTALHAPFVNDFTGFDQPWRLLAEFVPDLRVYELAFGTGYLTLGATQCRRTRQPTRHWCLQVVWPSRPCHPALGPYGQDGAVTES